MELFQYGIIVYSYLIGTIPSGFILVKLFSGKDIRDEGSGNVGARNSFDVTGNKLIGIFVLIFDLLKGILAIYLTAHIFGYGLYEVSLASVFVILGHNYNAFLGFKGGRGLATAAGAFIMIDPIVMVLWLLMYFSSYGIIKKDIHAATIIASVASPLMIWGMPEFGIKATQTLSFENITQFKILVSFVCLLIILKNIRPLRDKLESQEEANLP